MKGYKVLATDGYRRLKRITKEVTGGYKKLHVGLQGIWYRDCVEKCCLGFQSDEQNKLICDCAYILCFITLWPYVHTHIVSLMILKTILLRRNIVLYLVMH